MKTTRLSYELASTKKLPLIMDYCVSKSARISQLYSRNGNKLVVIGNGKVYFPNYYYEAEAIMDTLNKR